MSAPASPTAETPPNVAIRARPPSPKRLSRKVLMGAALIAGAIIVSALMVGLSPQQRRNAADQQASPTASGPPETIAQASSQYDAQTFVRQTAPAEPPLAPPQDPMWANAPQPANTTPASSGVAANTGAAARDPESVARSSPILFTAANANGADTANQDADTARLDAHLIPPASRYVIQSGNVIPAALVTGLNSDLAGRVIAQVTAPVYDSVTGDHLLIPQGSRLIGAYDNGVRYGDHRMLLVWNRLILPNGWSINLREMNASDPTGQAGLSDRTDNHLGSLAGAIGLSAIISVVANNSQDDQRTNGSLAQSVGDAAAQQAAQTGSQIVQRELSVHPTLRVRPGASVRVLVMRDISLRPYH